MRTFRECAARVRICISFLIVILLLPCCGSQPVVHFDETSVSMGKIYEGKKIVKVFNFTNEGPGDFQISGHESSCGCTDVEYDQRVFRPGESGTVRIRFDSTDRPGENLVRVVLFSNAAGSSLELTAFVIVEPDLTRARIPSRL